MFMPNPPDLYTLKSKPRSNSRTTRSLPTDEASSVTERGKYTRFDKSTDVYQQNVNFKSVLQRIGKKSRITYRRTHDDGRGLRLWRRFAGPYSYVSQILPMFLSRLALVGWALTEVIGLASTYETSRGYHVVSFLPQGL